MRAREEPGPDDTRYHRRGGAAHRAVRACVSDAPVWAISDDSLACV
jgi:hypothetical protein